MYAPAEPETFPPDVCYSREVNHANGWNQSNTLDLASNIECSTSSNTDDVDSEKYSPLNLQDEHTIEDKNDLSNESLEGAIGGMLPDLCVTGTGSLNVASIDLFHSNAENLSENEIIPEVRPISGFSEIEFEFQNNDDIQNIENDHIINEDSQTLHETIEESSQKNISYVPQAICLESEEYEEGATYETRTNYYNPNEFVVHHCKHINLVSCGTGDVQKVYDFKVNDEEQLSVVCSESHLSLCCDKFRALDKLCDLQTYGLELIKQNLIQSSDPSYHKWECSAIIPSYLLPPFSLHSHGTSLGCDAGSSYVLSFPVGRPLMNESESQLTEEEQIKMAKRYGLITHLPCGIFDGSTKSRECVICMIDFSVGDKVRYLPCMHTYHTECIDDWLMRSFTCPSCLEPVDAALLNTYETS